MEFAHAPVLLNETIDALQIRPGGIYVDGTIGGAGHAEQIVYRLSEEGHLFGFDRDEEAVRAATDRLERFSDRVRVFHDNYKNAVGTLKAEGITGADGILLDLGVSSHQIDEAERGFSYMQDGPLDMRMDRSEDLSAADIVNTFPEGALTQIFRDYGEEKYAAQIASAIVRNRAEQPVETTFQLNDIIYRSVPARARVKGSHPSKRIFQALRIAVNGELEDLGAVLTDMIGFLNPGGRLCVITFHSLEDRIVKQTFRTGENPCICPPKTPVCVCGRFATGRRIGAKAIRPKEEEIAANKRAKSASLRVFERTKE